MMKLILQTVFFVFPMFVRRLLYGWIWGYQISPNAKIGFSWILADELIMEEHTFIQSLTIVKNIDRLVMRKYSRIGPLNFITGFNTKISGIAFKKGRFSHVKGRKCELILEEDVAINSRHFIDCNGGVYFGKHSSLAGIRSQILTHGIDPYNSRQDAQPVIIGNYCSIGSGSIILKGTIIPDYAIVGAGAVLNKRYTESYKIYAGVPACGKKDLNYNEVKWFSRQSGDVI
ncbi:acyltransferase [Bacteroides nordii]|uniref:acyltransferase n=1 Tax=Bacteroides nordii TaxID=291645 RepID=UPI0024938EA9|nr:acyltransferase [Bacteroides nordii]